MALKILLTFLAAIISGIPCYAEEDKWTMIAALAFFSSAISWIWGF